MDLDVTRILGTRVSSRGAFYGRIDYPRYKKNKHTEFRFIRLKMTMIMTNNDRAGPLEIATHARNE